MNVFSSLIWCFCTAFLVCPPAASAQEAQALYDSEMSTELIERRIEQIEQSSAYADADKTEALDLYRQALTSLREADANAAAANAFSVARRSAVDEAGAIRARLDETREQEAAVLPDSTAAGSVREFELQLMEAQGNAAGIATRLAELERTMATEELRPEVARKQLARANAELREAAQALADQPVSDAADVVQEARRLNQESTTAALTSSINKLEQELLAHPLRLELLKAQRDLVSSQLGGVEALIERLQARLLERRRAETTKAIAETNLAASESAGESALVSELARGNQTLAGELGDLTTEVEEASARRSVLQSELDALQARFDSTQQRIDIGGVSPALGQYLGGERRNLPSLRNYRREAGEREEKIAEASLRNFTLDDAWNSIRNVDAFVAEKLATLRPEEAARQEIEIRSLAGTRSGLLDQIRRRNDEYLRLLADTDQIEQRRHVLIGKYQRYLAENLLWVRSKKVFGIADIAVLPREVTAFISPSMWLEASQVLRARIAHSPTLVIAWLALLVYWMRLGALSRLLRATAKNLGKPSRDTFLQTVKAVAITLVMTVPWPIATYITGYELGNSVDTNRASSAVGRGLMLISPLLFFLRGFRNLCTPDGVAERHFRWSREALTRMRRQLNLLLITLLIPAFVMIVNFDLRDAQVGGSLSQILFIVLAAGLVFFLYRLLNTNNGIAHALRNDGGRHSTIRGARLWLAAAITIPIGLALLAMMGYMYSAATLLGKLINSMWLVFGLVFLRELVFRWLLVLRRRLRMQQAIERREAAKQAALRQQGEPGIAASNDEIAAIAAPDEVDLVALDADTRTLVHVAIAVAGFVGFSAIWSGVMPALGVLNDLTLWQNTVTLDGAQQRTPVTLADLLLALLAVVLTFVAARTVPSLLEIILRQRPNVTPGTRLAFSTLTRYTVFVAGLGFILSTVGVNWSKLQWLVAALGVGIGFGLQEIVANFISGIVILVERPIRVGDIITVGESSGIVTRVQIRATTIRTWDRQELLVPNKEFITGRVLNWSLSDEVIRIHFMVGIAYGSDVETALKLIEEAASEHSAVLEDPAPLVTFESFGDNSLNLGLRCFVSSVSVRLETNTDLHRAINRKFNEAGIVIAFPQRDLHLDSASPIEIKLTHGNDGTPESATR